MDIDDPPPDNARAAARAVPYAQQVVHAYRALERRGALGGETLDTLQARYDTQHRIFDPDFYKPRIDPDYVPPAPPDVTEPTRFANAPEVRARIAGLFTGKKIDADEVRAHVKRARASGIPRNHISVKLSYVDRMQHVLAEQEEAGVWMPLPPAGAVGLAEGVRTAAEVAYEDGDERVARIRLRLTQEERLHANMHLVRPPPPPSTPIRPRVAAYGSHAL